MTKLDREQIEALNGTLNDVYDGYRAVVDFFNEAVKKGHFNPNTYTLELSEKQTQETLDSMQKELSNMECAIEEMKTLLGDMSAPEKAKAKR